VIDPASIPGIRYATKRSPERRTFGPAVGKVAASCGTPFMPWQQYVLDVALEVMPDGEWAYTDVVETVQRQQGKTTKDGPLGVHRCIAKPRSSSWVTAQSRQDARDNFIDGFVPDFNASPLARLGKVRESQGSERITFRKLRSLFGVFSPGEDALHGKRPAPQLVINDEHWVFGLDMRKAFEAAIGPTFLTSGGQWFRHSTAGTDKSEWLLTDVRAGRLAVQRDEREGMAYFEIGYPLDGRDELLALLQHEDDSPEFRQGVEQLAHYMPARGYTLKERVLLNAARTARRRDEVGDILRGFGNLWTPTISAVLPAAHWKAAGRDALPRPTVPVGLAFACARDRSDAAIVAAWREPGDARMRWRVIDHRAGVSWVEDRMAELIDERHPAAAGYDRFGPATDIGDALEQRGYYLERITYPEMATSCIRVLSDVVDDAGDGRLVYVKHEALDDVHERAAKKELGNRWVWDLKAGGSIAALDAGTMAGWFFDHAPVPLPAPDIRLPTNI